MSDALDYWNWYVDSSDRVRVGDVVGINPGSAVRMLYTKGALPGIWPIGSYVVLLLSRDISVRGDGSDALMASSYTPTPDSAGPGPDTIVFRDNSPHFAKSPECELSRTYYEVVMVEGFNEEDAPVKIGRAHV